MINKLSIKKKLLIYSFLIQSIILIIFSFSLYKALEISTLDKLQTTLKVIILDIADDILENKDKIESRNFDEEKEYKFEPLYIRLLKIDNEVKIIKNENFPKDILINSLKLKVLEKDTIFFENLDTYLLSRIKIKIDGNYYVLELATNNSSLNSTLENLLYILLFIVPIILLFSTIGGYFLINKSFLPIEKISKNLKNINAKDLSKRLDRLENYDEIDLLTIEINNLLIRLENSFENISQFSSDASHELKTPLTIIRGEIEIGLRKERSSSEYKEILNSSLDEILIIQKTIDDLLFLAKSEQNIKPMEKDDIYLDEITIESIHELESFAKLKFIKLILKIENPIQIRGYSKLLKIAIKNIIKNAISFSHKNSKVVVSNYIEDEKYIISIQDFGIGINLKEQEKIFEKFYRTDKSRNKYSGGTGLGMSISKKIINIHNAKIEIFSQENIGTMVKIIMNK